jgi:hypothetical protein
MRGLCASDVPGLCIQAQFDKGMGCAVETTAGQRGSGRSDTPRPRVPPSGIPRVPCANCVRVHMSARPGSPPVGSGTPPLRSHRPAVVTSHASPFIDRQHAVRAQSDKLPRCDAPLGCIADPTLHVATARYFEQVSPRPGLRPALWRHRSSPPCQAPRSEIHYRFSRYTSRQDLVGFDERSNSGFSAVCTSVQPNDTGVDVSR